MRVDTLPPMRGPLAVYGGPVSNAHAMAAALRTFDEHDLEQAVCTGDLAAYCGDPYGTISMVRRAGHPVVAGNCERQIAAGAQDCGCGFEEGTVCDAMSGTWWAHVLGETTPDDAAWMAELPDMLILDHDGIRTAVLHGGATDIARFVWPSDADDVFHEEIAAIRAAAGPVDRVLAGHCGVPFERVVDGVSWVNAGSIGMPPHDGRAETRWALIDADGVRFKRLSYDHEGAACAMEAAGLVQGYQTALRTGYWPSEDVLPTALRRRTAS